MKNLILLTILGLACIQPFVEALFFGPIAVGLGLGLLGLKKGLIIGSALGRGRSRYSGNQYSGNYQHSTRQSSCHYQRRNHYDTHTYSGCYAQPNKVRKSAFIL